MFSVAHIWVWLLAPLPWLVARWLPPRHEDAAAVRVPFGDRLERAQKGRSLMARAAKGRMQWGPRLTVWILALFAVSRPQWIEPPVSRSLPTRDLLLLVDLSGSMQQEDFLDAEGDAMSRLAAVKDVMGDFLADREGDRVGLVVFGNAAYLQAPFSTDLTLSRSLLEETAVGIAGPKTAFGDAIGLGIRVFEDSRAPAKTMIALTDGNDTSSRLPPVEAAHVAAQREIRIHTVAIGDPTTVGEDPLDEATLQEVARTAGGSYFFAADRQALAGIYDELDRIETRDVQVVSHRPRTDLFYWPLLAALLVSLAHAVPAILQNQRISVEASTGSGAVRVNPRTGELEAAS